MKHKIYLSLLATVFMAGCSTTDEDFARFETYDCFALAKEIGRNEAQLKSAKADETIAVIEQIFGDDDDQGMAVIDEISADIEGDRAREYLNRLNTLKYQKGCR